MPKSGYRFRYRKNSRSGFRDRDGILYQLLIPSLKVLLYSIRKYKGFCENI
ncbi:hypothetical protein HanIR_Chr05g0225601 [Helianthus annuus]|nr:hypothetical protein HanIR_Chr05g0225601 [Helianthus annuus]